MEKVITADHLTFSYPGSAPIFQRIFPSPRSRARSSESPVRWHVENRRSEGRFLCEYPYEGHLTYGGRELSSCTEQGRSRLVGYLGHDPELLGRQRRRTTCSLGTMTVMSGHGCEPCALDEEVREMEETGEDTVVGNSGVRLSGGQAARLALARTLCHKKPILRSG